MRNLFILALLAAVTPCISAQRAGFSFHGFSGNGFGRSGHSRAAFYPAGFSDPFYSDYLSSLYSAGPQSPIIFLQSPSAAVSEPFRFPSPAQPIMIELQGDRYVRLSGEENSGAALLGPEAIDMRRVQQDMTGQNKMGRDRMGREEFAREQIGRGKIGRPKLSHEETGSSSRRSEQSVASIYSPAPTLAPAVLVFRDGHHEEVSDYTIADGILYTHGNLYTAGAGSAGSWNRKIVLSSLNLPETMLLNHSHGVNFQLPTAPNEVIVR